MLTWSGTMWRGTAPGRDPLSGRGAQINGGRWNPPGISTVYAGFPRATTMREMARTAERYAAGVPLAELRRVLHEIEARDLELADLREPTRYIGSTTLMLENVHLMLENVHDDDHTRCQQVGAEIHERTDAQGILAPSATGEGFVVAIFIDRTAPGQLEVVASTNVVAVTPRARSTPSRSDSPREHMWRRHRG